MKTPRCVTQRAQLFTGGIEETYGFLYRARSPRGHKLAHPLEHETLSIPDRDSRSPTLRPDPTAVLQDHLAWDNFAHLQN